MYRDGVLLASQTCLFSSIITGVGGWGDAESTFIGTVDDGNIRNEFNGAIDEVRFYNRDLSPAEVLDLYNGAPPLSPPTEKSFFDRVREFFRLK